MERRQISVRDGAFSAQTFVGGQGDPLVFLHGEGGPLGAWPPFLEALAEQYTVYAPLHPGYGRSTGVDRLEDLLDLGVYYLDFFDAIGADRPYVIGHSMGGLIAAEAASLDSRRIKKLVLVNAAGFWLDEAPIPDFPVMPPKLLRPLIFHDPESELAYQLLPNEPETDAQAILALENASTAAKFLWGLMYDPALIRRMHRIKTPTLVVWGESDRLLQPVYADEWVKHLPDARKVIITEAGHAPPNEQPDEFVRLVEEFFTAE